MGWRARQQASDRPRSPWRRSGRDRSAAKGAPTPARNVPLISVTAGFATTWYLTWSPVLPLLLGSRGASPAAIAATFALVNLCGALIQYVGGRLADRVGVRRVIGWTGVALGCTWFAMAAASGDWLGLAVFYVLGNTLFGLQATAFVTVISDSVPIGRRLRAFSFYQFWSAASFVAGPLAGGLLLLPRLAPPVYLGLTGLVYLSVGIVRLAFLREPRQLTGRPNPPATPRRILAALAGSAERRELAALSAGVTLAFALTVNGPFIPVTVHVLAGIPPRVVEILFGVGPVGALAVSLAARLVRSHRRTLAWGLAILALAAAALALPLGMVGLAAAFLLAFAGFQLTSVAFAVLRVRLAGEDAPGEVLGASSAMAGTAAFLGVAVAGAAGGRVALLAGAAIAVATGVWQVRGAGRALTQDMVVDAGASSQGQMAAAGRPGEL